MPLLQIVEMLAKTHPMWKHNNAAGSVCRSRAARTIDLATPLTKIPLGLDSAPLTLLLRPRERFRFSRLSPSEKDSGPLPRAPLTDFASRLVILSESTFRTQPFTLFAFTSTLSPSRTSINLFYPTPISFHPRSRTRPPVDASSRNQHDRLVTVTRDLARDHRVVSLVEVSSSR